MTLKRSAKLGIGFKICENSLQQIMVSEIFQGSSAHEQGMTSGDLILAVDGTPLTGMGRLEATKLLIARSSTVLLVAPVQTNTSLLPSLALEFSPSSSSSPMAVSPSEPDKVRIPLIHGALSPYSEGAIVHVALSKSPEGHLGINLIGGPATDMKGIFVSSFKENSPGINSCLRAGHRLLYVNDVSYQFASLAEATRAIKAAGPDVKFVFQEVDPDQFHNIAAGIYLDTDSSLSPVRGMVPPDDVMVTPYVTGPVSNATRVIAVKNEKPPSAEEKVVVKAPLVSTSTVSAAIFVPAPVDVTVTRSAPFNESEILVLPAGVIVADIRSPGGGSSIPVPSIHATPTAGKTNITSLFVPVAVAPTPIPAVVMEVKMSNAARIIAEKKEKARLASEEKQAALIVSVTAASTTIDVVAMNGTFAPLPPSQLC